MPGQSTLFTSKSLLLIAIHLLIPCFLASCSRPCLQTELRYDLSGYDSTELTQIRLKECLKGTQCTTILETKEFSYWDRDTTPPPNLRISADLDWVIELPLAGVSHRIEHISYLDDRQGRSPFGLSEVCMNGIDYLLDGVPKHKNSFYDYAPGPHTILIEKK